jgi:hypothetical protein
VLFARCRTARGHRQSASAGMPVQQARDPPTPGHLRRPVLPALSADDPSGLKRSVDVDGHPVTCAQLVPAVIASAMSPSVIGTSAVSAGLSAASASCLRASRPAGAPRPGRRAATQFHRSRLDPHLRPHPRPPLHQRRTTRRRCRPIPHDRRKVQTIPGSQKQRWATWARCPAPSLRRPSAGVAGGTEIMP